MIVNHHLGLYSVILNGRRDLVKSRRTFSAHTWCLHDIPLNVYLHFMLFLHIDMAQVVEILIRVRQQLTYST